MKMIKWLLLCYCISSSCYAGDFCNSAVFNILNKTNNKVTTVEIALGNYAQIDNTAIRPISCWQDGLRYNLKSSQSYIEVYQQYGEGFEKKYQGWVMNYPPKNYASQNNLEFILIECNKCTY